MKEQIARFLDNEDNKTAIKLLISRMKDASDIRLCKDAEDFEAKREALAIVDGWLEEVFNVKYQDIQLEVETDYDELVKNIE